MARTDAASGAVLELSIGNLNDHDAKLGRALWNDLDAGEIVIADRGFSSDGFWWGMQRREVWTVVRQHQRRQHQRPLPEEVGAVLDFDEVWQRPSRHPDWWDADLPPQLTVRVVAQRVSEQTVVVLNTTLPRADWSAADVLRWYRGRQRIETGFRELKVGLAAGFLEVGDPDVAVVCLWGAVLTHNLLCCVMSEAATEAGKSRWDLSYQTCLNLVRLPLWAGAAAGPEEACKRVRRELTRDAHPRRPPDRREPRARKALHRRQKRLKAKRDQELVRLGR